VEDKSYFKYWGKASKEDGSYHLLPYHCLDVAAVAAVLLSRNPSLVHTFIKLTGIDEGQFKDWYIFLLALHDIGKFADSFQNLKSEVLQQLQHRTSHRQYGLRHDSSGFILWKKHLRPEFQRHGLIPQIEGSHRRRASEQSIDFWMAAMVGHHGQPPQVVTNRLLSDDFNETDDFVAVTQFLDDLIAVLLPDKPIFPECKKEKVQLASWWLSGLAVLCDWIGSNTDYFPYQEKDVPLVDYWGIAKQNAERAIVKTGILQSQSSVLLTLNDLVEVDVGSTLQPTPLQVFVSQLEIPSSPHLFILEDVTGAGKTEAAVLLAHKLMKAGQANSLYFALPTMATANTMYSRMRKVYRKLFADNALPSLVLAHGASNLSAEFRQSIISEAPVSIDAYGDGTDTAQAHCNAWLADNRKKALLANVGIGTIDQALLAILPARHQSLRLLGLANKILLVDEVHACDAYMHELLCALLRAHAAAGGSVILLSATLPQKQRQALLNAYAEGQKWNKPKLHKIDKKSYPLATCFNDNGLREKIVDTRESVRREVVTEFLSNTQDIDDVLKTVIAQGQCACWIRNTVKDAIDAWQQTRQLHPDWSVDLFHARFALGDRLDAEQRVVKRFGKTSTAPQRRGKILIATQVVEQSLDLDFDTLITDLAPIDLLIQRAGRLRRHTRDKAGGRIDGKDQRGEVCLHIFSPEITKAPNKDWYAGFFSNAQKVYENHGQLWLAANLLHGQGKFRMPEDARSLIEDVYGDEAQNSIPEALLNQSLEAEGNDRADASVGRLNVLSMEVGYSDASTNRWWDESITPTRLGEQTSSVYLARWEDGKLLPWFSDKHHPWPLSSVSMRRYWIAAEATMQGISLEQIEQYKATLPAKGKWGILLPLIQISEDNWQGVALNEKQETVYFIYNKNVGLMVDNEPQKRK